MYSAIIRVLSENLNCTHIFTIKDQSTTLQVWRTYYACFVFMVCRNNLKAIFRTVSKRQYLRVPTKYFHWETEKKMPLILTKAYLKLWHIIQGLIKLKLLISVVFPEKKYVERYLTHCLRFIVIFGSVHDFISYYELYKQWLNKRLSSAEICNCC